MDAIGVEKWYDLIEGRGIKEIGIEISRIGIGPENLNFMSNGGIQPFQNVYINRSAPKIESNASHPTDRRK